MILKEGMFFPDSDTHFSSSVFELHHLYESLKYVKTFRTSIDCGGHVGGWTMVLAEKFDKVYVFEPSTDNFTCLLENTRGFDNIVYINAALGNKKTTGSLNTPINPGNSGASWVVNGTDFDILRLDDLGIKDVDYLKLDVEGYEPFVIEGAKETIEKYHPVILVEQKPITARYGLDHMEAGRLLTKMGYSLEDKLNNDFIYVWK